MIINLRRTAYFLFATSVFLFAFEQGSEFFFGYDSFLKPYRITLLLAVALLITRPLRMSRPIRNLTIALFAIYAFGIFLAFVRTPFFDTSVSLTLHQAQLFIIAFAFFVIAVSTIDRPEQILRVTTVILLSSVLSSLIWLSFNSISGLFRVSGFFRNPNHYAFLLAISLLVSIYYITRNIDRPLVVGALLAWFFAGVLLLVLTGSRGGIGTTAPAMVLFLIRFFALRGPGRSSRAVVGLGLVVAFAVALPYLLSSDLLDARLLSRFSAEQIETGSGRQDLWRAGMLAAGDALYTGIGMGQYIGVHSYYIRQVDGAVYQTVLEYDLGLHSEYVNLFVEFGFISLVAYLVAIFWIWRGVLAFGRAYPEWKHLSGFLEALLVLDLLFAATQDMYFFPYHWLVLGLCAALINVRHLHARALA